MIALVWGVMRLRPEVPPPPFDQLYQHAERLRDAQLYVEASAYVEELLLDEELPAEARRRLHQLQAEIIYAHELGNSVHGRENAQRILDHTDAALAEHEGHDGATHLMRARAYEWLKQPESAVREYRLALARGVDDPWRVRKRTLEVLREIGGVAAEELHEAYDAFVAEKDIADDLLYWAAHEKVELLALENRREEAEAFLAEHAERFLRSDMRESFEYLQALAWYQLDRLDEAERLLRSLRERVVPGDAVYASASWLLGRILQSHEAPAYALSVFEEVLRTTARGPYWTASKLGAAESLAALERYEESVAAYEEAVRLATEDPYGAVVDLDVVRGSATAWYQALLAQGLLNESMAYLRLAARLVPPADGEAQALYVGRLADLGTTLGRERLEAARHADPERREALDREGRSLLVEAGEAYLQLAQLLPLDTDRASAAVWQAADVFDLAGERRRTAEVLETFVRERPTSPRTPGALYRLGQTYQAAGEFEKAIERYQLNLQRFPTTPPATASLVPLADCFLATDQLDKAEQTLLRIVEWGPEDRIQAIEPISREFRDALFRLGDLYMQIGRYEEAVARYEEAVERYADDPRTDRAVFMLAEAYRRSAAAIRESLNDPRNLPYQDQLLLTHDDRLLLARRTYDRVIERFQHRPEDGISGLDRLYVKLSHFYRADAVFDLSRLDESTRPEPFREALELYDRAAWVYQDDPMAMGAYVQMINCHLRLGDIAKARATLQRARWALRSIPDEQFRSYIREEDRAYWERYLAWLERSPLLRARPGEDATG